MFAQSVWSVFSTSWNAGNAGWQTFGAPPPDANLPTIFPQADRVWISSRSATNGGRPRPLTWKGLWLKDVFFFEHQKCYMYGWLTYMKGKKNSHIHSGNVDFFTHSRPMEHLGKDEVLNQKTKVDSIKLVYYLPTWNLKRIYHAGNEHIPPGEKENHLQKCILGGIC